MTYPKPMLSIVIPTKNRQKYAIPCINSILSINDNRLELVVHDNSETNVLETYLKNNFIDKRLVYRYNPKPMSTVHNFNESMKYVNGEYVCFIGDDDGINPSLIDVALWAKKNNIDAVRSDLLIFYLWPNNSRTGQLSISPFTGKATLVNIEKELKCFLKDGGVDYMRHKIPKVYHGIVRKECFDKIKDKLGYYFGGLTPDIFSAISISLVANKVFSVDYPLTIAGSSAASEETHRTEQARNTPLKDAPHLRNRGPYNWSDRVPAVYSGESVWAESAIKALEAFSRTDLIAMIDRFKLAAQIAIPYPHYEKIILNDFLKGNEYSLTALRLHVAKLSIILMRFIRRITFRIRMITMREFLYKHDHVDASVDAMEIVRQYLNKKNMCNYFYSDI